MTLACHREVSNGDMEGLFMELKTIGEERHAAV